MKLMLDWNPLVSIGPFVFGEPIYNYIRKYDLREIPEEYVPEVNWQVYALSDESVRIYSEDGVISAIACYKECIYQNTNIIGLSLSEVIDLLNRVPDDYSTEEMSDGEQEIFDFNEYDLQIWINDNKVVTAFCSGEYEAG